MYYAAGGEERDGLDDYERFAKCVTMSHYMSVIFCLGFQDDVARVAAEDALGRDLQDAAL